MTTSSLRRLPRRRVPTAALFAFVFLALSGLFLAPSAAAAAAHQSYDLPPGDAEQTLRLFSQQSRQQILYPPNEVSGVQTNAVRGDYSPRQALDAMLAGTILQAEEEAGTGAFTVRRKAPVAAAVDPAPASSAPEQPVQMSTFEVTTTQGRGYVATTSATGFKTDQPLMDIPQGDIVVTNDFIKDSAYENNTDVLQYFGVNQLIQGALFQLRGLSLQSNPYMDEMITHSFYEDDAIVDSYEVVKGPAQSLYVGAGLGGVVLETTKKPLPYRQEIIFASVDQNGLYRFMTDLTGPIGKLGDFDLAYRFVGVFQHGNEYFYNTNDDREVLFPELSLKYHNTSVRFYYNQQHVNGLPGLGFINGSGHLEESMGWKGANQYAPSNQPVYWNGITEYIEFLQKISDSWENRLSASHWKYSTDGPGMYPDSINLNAGTETWGSERGDEHWQNWTVLDDWQGHYQFGPDNWRVNNTDSFGFAYSSAVDKQLYYGTSPFPYPNGPVGGTVTIPYNSPAALHAIVTAPANDIAPPTPAQGSPGVDAQVQIAAIYWQHSIDAIPNWLTLTAGYTWDNVSKQTVSNWAILPWTGTIVTAHQWVYRLGAVVHLTNSLSLYALDSSNFLTPSGAFLQNGQLAPNQIGLGTELGVKWNLLGGRMSGEAAWYKLVSTNGLNRAAGINPNGIEYAAVIGNVTEEGVDGDAAFTIVPGWQLIGSWYAGHEVDPSDKPVPFSSDNSLSAFMRYDFGKTSVLDGLAIGAGVSRTGGRWMSTGGLVATPAVPSVVKVQSGTLVNAFVSYQFTKHWFVRANVANILNQEYPVAIESPLYVDPSEPTIFSIATSYKF
jgi:outer membrane receptor protein involved in Fe transport